MKVEGIANSRRGLSVELEYGIPTLKGLAPPHIIYPSKMKIACGCIASE
jgi:hypothetical protein